MSVSAISSDRGHGGGRKAATDVHQSGLRRGCVERNEVSSARDDFLILERLSFEADQGYTG